MIWINSLGNVVTSLFPLGRFPPPSTEKMGQIPTAVKSAAFMGKRLKYGTPTNRTFAKKRKPCITSFFCEIQSHK
jgi:hypothetical protein